MISFVINIFDEPKDQVKDLVKSLKDTYAKCQVLLVYDGIERYKIRGTKELEGEHLKDPKNGGKWTHRYLSFANEHAEFKHIIKLDPDTKVITQATDLPTTNCIFGNVIETKFGKTTFKTVHGGALGFTNDVVQWITENEWMLNPKFISNARYNNFNDFMLRDVIAEQNIPLIHRTDFATGKASDETSTFVHH